MFVSPLQGRVTKKKGWKATVGGRQREGSFNVCLPREAIKINTSNYQAVLNFLGATSPGTPPPSSPLVTPFSHRLRHPRHPFSRNSVPSASDRPTRRISLHSRAFYFQQVLQLRDAEVFLNFKGENAVLKKCSNDDKSHSPSAFFLFVLHSLSLSLCFSFFFLLFSSLSS